MPKRKQSSLQDFGVKKQKTQAHDDATKDSREKRLSIIDRRDGDLHALVIFYPRLFVGEADALQEELQSLSSYFTADVYHMYGKDVPSPRLVCSFGDSPIRFSDVSSLVFYSYTGVKRTARGWSPLLRKLRDKIQPLCSHPLNYALVNMYRDGRDAIGWHSDKEKDLVPGATIASASLGATRTFILRDNDSKEQRQVDLSHGSLLLMEHDTQKMYEHCLPKRPRIKETRFNITFRSVRVQPARPTRDVSGPGNAEKGRAARRRDDKNDGKEGKEGKEGKGHATFHDGTDGKDEKDEKCPDLKLSRKMKQLRSMLPSEACVAGGIVLMAGDPTLASELKQVTGAARVVCVENGPENFSSRPAATHSGGETPITVESTPSLEDLSSAESAFDLAACLLSIHHVRDTDRAVLGLSRAVKPGGYLFVQEHDVADETLRQYLDMYHRKYREHAFEVTRYCAREELASKLSSCGFQLLTEASEEGTNPLHLYYALYQRQGPVFATE